MPTCCDCRQELGRAAFAKSQLKKGPTKRRCLGCASDADFSASNSGGGEARTCWICLCDDHSKEEPIVRDCACRGTAGYAHLRCLVRSATFKTESMTEEAVKTGTTPSLGAHTAGSVVNPWEECVTCRQPYSNPSRSRMALAEAAYEKYGSDDNATPPWRKVSLQALATAKDGAGDHAGARVLMESYVDILRVECDVYGAHDGGSKRAKACRCDLVYALCNLAVACENLGAPRDIPPLLEEGLRCLDGIGGAEGGDACRARILVIYGAHAIETGSTESAVEYLSEAIELMRTTNPNSLNLSHELWRCGHLRFEAGETRRGVGEMSEALEIHERLSGSADKLVVSRRAILADLVEMAKPIATGRCLEADRNGMIHPATAKLGPKVDILRFIPSDMAYAVKEQGGGDSVSVRSVKEVRLERGTHVLLYGLPARYKMDGCCGVVEEYLKHARAYNVSLNGLGMVAQVSSVQCYAAKPSNECCLK